MNLVINGFLGPFYITYGLGDDGSAPSGPFVLFIDPRAVQLIN